MSTPTFYNEHGSTLYAWVRSSGGAWEAASNGSPTGQVADGATINMTHSGAPGGETGALFTESSVTPSDSQTGAYIWKSSYSFSAAWDLEQSDTGSNTWLDQEGSYNSPSTISSDSTAPTISTVALAADNSTATVTFSEAVYDTSGGSGDLEAADFALSLSGGVSSTIALNATPSSIAKTSQTIWVLTLNGTNLSSIPTGSETLVVDSASDTSIYDAAGNAHTAAHSGQALNDVVSPTISSISYAASTSVVTVSFDSAVYSTNGGSGGIAAADFTATISGGSATSPSVGSVTHSAGATSATFTLTFSGTRNGREVLTIQPATSGAASIWDAAGNAMATAQTGNTCKLLLANNGGDLTYQQVRLNTDHFSSTTTTSAIKIDPNFLGTFTAAAVDVSADHIAFLDGGATGTAKIESIADLVGGIAGTVTSTGLSDSNGVLSLDISNMTPATTVADDDLVAIYDTSASALRKMTRANFIESLLVDGLDMDGATIDGAPIGGTTPAAAAFTTLTSNAATTVTLATDSSSSTSGALVVTGGVGIAKKLYVGTDLDVDGTTNLDAVDIDGAVQIDGAVTVGVDNTGQDVKFFGDTAGSFLLWDQSADALLLTDSTPIQVGDAQDMTLYHDGTNSFLTNKTGAMKIATETSGIAVTIGHTTSETTVADNLTVTGDVSSIGGTLSVTGVLSPTTHVDMPDSANVKLGTGDDLQLYHDGTNSYITNSTGALKVATETSGIAVTIGHTTSETTVADNLTVTGNIDSSGDLTMATITCPGFAVDADGDTSLKSLAVDTDSTIGCDADADLMTIGNAALTLKGTLTIGVDGAGHDTKLFGDTAGSFLLWDQSADSLLLTDSTPIKIGDAQDMTLYHDGTNSYLTNKTGAMKIATETSGIALTIGHTTSETTVADNLTVTGDVSSIGGTLSVTGVLSPTTHVDMPDSAKIKLGTGDDLNIYHDGTNSFIDNATGALKVATATSGIAVTIGHTTSETTVADNLTVTGDVSSVGGTLSVTGQINATSHIDMPDSANIKLGTGDDLQLYHDGTNSYMTNATGAMKIATETSGIAVTIGHATSEVTVADNLTVTGNLTVSGTTTTVDSTTVAIADSMMKLAKDQGTSADAVDFGIYGKYGVGGTAKYAGIFRDLSASGDPWTFFDTLEDEPGATVDTGGTNYAKADVVMAGLDATSIALNSGGITAAGAIAGAAAIAMGGALSGATTIAGSGLASLGSLAVDDGSTIGCDSDADLLTLASAALTLKGTLTVGIDNAGHDVKLFGDTAGSYMLWDQSADALLLTDSTPIQIGDAQDMTLYHDGSNSYLTNKTGAMKIATETSGIAVTIGHTTSEVTVADNLSVTGDIDVDGTTNLDAVDIDGAVQIDGAVTVGVDNTGLDVKFFGDTSGSFLLWDQSADSLLLTDSTPIKIGDAQDLTLYHDGSNSYITNAVGALKIATETSGIAVTIGHGTSEVTVADNLTVSGDLAVTGTLNQTSHIDMPDSAKIKLGTGDDLNIYHDGSNSYIANSTGALKLATETSGIAVTIGHSTSEVTIADNLTVTGNQAAGTVTSGTWNGTAIATAYIAADAVIGTKMSPNMMKMQSGSNPTASSDGSYAITLSTAAVSASSVLVFINGVMLTITSSSTELATGEGDDDKFYSDGTTGITIGANAITSTSDRYDIWYMSVA